MRHRSPTLRGKPSLHCLDPLPSRIRTSTMESVSLLPETSLTLSTSLPTDMFTSAMYLETRDKTHYLNTELARSTFALVLFLPLTATVALVARFYARHWRSIKLGWDDWLALFALVRSYREKIKTAAHTWQIFHYCHVAGVFLCKIMLQLQIQMNSVLNQSNYLPWLFRAQDWERVCGTASRGSQGTTLHDFAS